MCFIWTPPLYILIIAYWLLFVNTFSKVFLFNFLLLRDSPRVPPHRTNTHSRRSIPQKMGRSRQGRRDKPVSETLVPPPTASTFTCLFLFISNDLVSEFAQVPRHLFVAEVVGCFCAVGILELFHLLVSSLYTFIITLFIFPSRVF